MHYKVEFVLHRREAKGKASSDIEEMVLTLWRLFCGSYIAAMRLAYGKDADFRGFYHFPSPVDRD